MVPSVSCVLSVSGVLNDAFGQLCAVCRLNGAFGRLCAVRQWSVEWCLRLAVCCLSVER